jgi:molybdopterin converting factor small subunit
MEFVKSPTTGCWPAVNLRQPPDLSSHGGANSGKVGSSVQIRVHFYSYCKELAGAASVIESVEPGSRIEDLLQKLFARLPKLASMQKSLLVAVGVDYQRGDYVLQEGDEVSLFPPVQGG